MPAMTRIPRLRAPLGSRRIDFRFTRLLLLLSASSSVLLAQDLPSTRSATTSQSFDSTSSRSSSATTSSTSSDTISSSHSSVFTPTLSSHIRPTSFSTTTASNSSSSIAPSQASRPGLGGTDSLAGSVPSDAEPSSGLLNYYFAFLAVFIILLFVAVWYIHRRKQKAKAMRASSRQDALTRDLDGWTGRRRWIGGAWRGGIGRREVRDEPNEEGLNELGEAPPPYKARDSETGSEGRRSGESAQPAAIVRLRPLSREGRGARRPPDYHETIREESREDGDLGEPSSGNASSSPDSIEALREGIR